MRHAPCTTLQSFRSSLFQVDRPLTIPEPSGHRFALARSRFRPPCGCLVRLRTSLSLSVGHTGATEVVCADLFEVCPSTGSRSRCGPLGFHLSFPAPWPHRHPSPIGCRSGKRSTSPSNATPPWSSREPASMPLRATDWRRRDDPVPPSRSTLRATRPSSQPVPATGGTRSSRSASTRNSKPLDGIGCVPRSQHLGWPPLNSGCRTAPGKSGWMSDARI